MEGEPSQHHLRFNSRTAYIAKDVWLKACSCVYKALLLYRAWRYHSPPQALQRQEERSDDEDDGSSSGEDGGARHCATFHQQCGRAVWIFVARSRSQRYGWRIDPQRGQSAEQACVDEFQEEGSDFEGCHVECVWYSYAIKRSVYPHIFTCIRRRCRWGLTRKRRRRKEDVCPWWLISRGV